MARFVEKLLLDSMINQIVCEALLVVTWLSDSLKIGYITYDNSVSFVKDLYGNTSRT